MGPRSSLGEQCAADLVAPFLVTNSWEARLKCAYSRNFISLVHNPLCLSQHHLVVIIIIIIIIIVVVVVTIIIIISIIINHDITIINYINNYILIINYIIIIIIINYIGQKSAMNPTRK